MKDASLASYWGIYASPGRASLQLSRPGDETASNWTETGKVNVALATFTFPLDQELHPRTGDGGTSSLEVFLSASPTRQGQAIPPSSSLE